MNENDLVVITLLAFELGFAYGAAYCIVHLFFDDIVEWFKKKFDKLKKMWYNIIIRKKGKSSPKNRANNKLLTAKLGDQNEKE